MTSLAGGASASPTLTLTAAFEGIEGSYSHVILDAYAAGRGVAFAPLGRASYRGVAHAVLSGRAEVGLLPVDNAIAGTIRESYDVLTEYELDLLAEITLPDGAPAAGRPRGDARGAARGRLAPGRPGRVRPVPRHAAQGARASRSPTPAIAARDIAAAADRSRAAIASAEAARRYGLVELATTIADHPDNFTRFLLFRAPSALRPGGRLRAGGRLPGAQDLALLRGRRTGRGRSGRCLSILGEHGLNLSKLDSKTRLGRRGEYAFYADVDGDVREERFAERAARAARGDRRAPRARQLRCRRARRRACAARRASSVDETPAPVPTPPAKSAFPRRTRQARLHGARASRSATWSSATATS